MVNGHCRDDRALQASTRRIGPPTGAQLWFAEKLQGPLGVNRGRTVRRMAGTMIECLSLQVSKRHPPTLVLLAEDESGLPIAHVSIQSSSSAVCVTGRYESASSFSFAPIKHRLKQVAMIAEVQYSRGKKPRIVGLAPKDCGL